MQTQSRTAACTAGALTALIVGLSLLVLLAGPAARASSAMAPAAAARPTITAPITTGRTTPQTTTPRSVPNTTATTRPSVATLPRTVTTVARSGGPILPYTTVPAATTTVSSTTATTIAGINGQVPSAPATVPLTTRASNGHVNFVFAWISVGGFAVALAMVAWRLFVTRAGGLDRAPYTERAPSEVGAE